MMVGQNNDGGVYQMGLDGTLGSGQAVAGRLAPVITICIRQNTETDLGLGWTLPTLSNNNQLKLSNDNCWTIQIKRGEISTPPVF